MCTKCNGCMLQVVRGRFTNIQLVACLSGGLAQYHPGLGVGFVDSVLEDIREGLENPTTGTSVSALLLNGECSLSNPVAPVFDDEVLRINGLTIMSLLCSTVCGCML